MPKEVDAVTKLYDFLLWMISKIKKFPRSQKFVLGDRIENLMLDILGLLIEAAYFRRKQQVLRDANLKLENLRYQIRLSKYPCFASFFRYVYGTQNILIEKNHAIDRSYLE